MTMRKKKKRNEGKKGLTIDPLRLPGRYGGLGGIANGIAYVPVVASLLKW